MKKKQVVSPFGSLDLYQPENAQLLVCELNRARPNTRILHVLELIKRLLVLAPVKSSRTRLWESIASLEMEEAEPGKRLDAIRSDSVEHSSELATKKDLFQELDKYVRSLRPKLVLQFTQELQCWTEFQCSSKTKELEFFVVRTLLGLVADSRIHLLRQCEQCRYWMFAHQKSQSFCSARCRQAAFQLRDDVKQRRNENRRKRYREERSRAEKALENARTQLKRGSSNTRASDTG